jgi:hypothetical protein
VAPCLHCPLVEGRRLCSSSTAHFHCSRLYFPVTLARSEQLRLPVHNFITLSPVDPLRKINELAAGQFTTLFHHYREYHWERCKTIAAAVEFHRDLIRDHNRLPHWAHRFRQDQKRTPLQVLGAAQGKSVEPATLQSAFGQRYCQRRTDEHGFVRLGRWKIYVEEGLPRTPVQLSYWDGKLRAEYGAHQLTEYQCQWGKNDSRPREVSHPISHEHPFQTKQQDLFDPLWLRDPIAPGELPPGKTRRAASKESQMRLYFGPELVKRAS